MFEATKMQSLEFNPRRLTDATSLKSFECPVCMEYFKKPILQCVTGHSICFTCKTKVDKCPLCAKNLTDTRNFVLESILQHVKVECKNANCTKVIPLHNYSQHVDDQCPHRNIKCKHPNCNWSDKKELVNDHIKLMHSSLIVQNYVTLLSHQLASAFIEHGDAFIYVQRILDDKYLIWIAQATVGFSVNKLFLIVKIISPNGSYSLKQPVCCCLLDDIQKAKEKSMLCVLKSKIKNCEVQIAIENEKENNVTVDTLLS